MGHAACAYMRDNKYRRIKITAGKGRLQRKLPGTKCRWMCLCCIFCPWEEAPRSGELKTPRSPPQTAPTPRHQPRWHYSLLLSNRRHHTAGIPHHGPVPLPGPRSRCHTVSPIPGRRRRGRTMPAGLGDMPAAGPRTTASAPPPSPSRRSGCLQAAGPPPRTSAPRPWAAPLGDERGSSTRLPRRSGCWHAGRRAL